MLQHSEHRTTGGAMRLTIVAQADAVTAAWQPNQIRPAVVRCIGKFALRFANEQLRIGDSFHWREGADEPTVIDHRFGAMPVRQDWIARPGFLALSHDLVDAVLDAQTSRHHDWMVLPSSNQRTERPSGRDGTVP